MYPRPKARFLLCLLILVILASACQAPTPAPAPKTAPPAATPPAATPPTPPPASQAKEAPVFRGTDLLTGQEVNFPAASSGRAAVLMFFSVG